MINIKQKTIDSFDYAHEKISYYFAHNKKICWIIGLLIVAVSFCLRSTMYIGSDPAFYYLTAEKLLKGERYYYDFFESNFPLNFYIYTIPVIFHKITAIAPIPSFYGFITFIALIGIYCSSLILKKSFIYKDGAFYNLFIMACFFGHFFPIGTFPYNEIGTKSLLFISFILPYLCSFFLEADNKKLSTNINIIIGLFAGLAVCLKPHYAIFPIVMESYRLLQNRNFRSIFRPINYSIVIVNIIHVLWLVFFVPEYLFKVVPILTVAYHGIREHIFLSAIGFVALEQMALIIILFIIFNKIPRSKYNNILLAAVVATSLICGIEGLYSEDQMSIMFFFDGLLLVKIMLDIYRNKPKIGFVGRSVLALSFTSIMVITISNFIPKLESINISPLGAMIKVNDELSNGEPVMVLSGNTYSQLSFYIHNTYIQNMVSLVYIRGTRGTKGANEEDPASYRYKLAEEAEKYFVDLQIQYISKYKPKVLFIDNKVIELITRSGKDLCAQPYIEYFQQYEDFREVFANYEFYDRIISYNSANSGKDANKRSNDLSVYIRKEPGAADKPPLKFQGVFF